MCNVNAKRAILEELKNWDVTEDFPVPVKALAAIAGIDDKESCPKTRKIILEMIEKDKVAIGSNTKGYFLIKTEKEMQKVFNGWMRRQLAMTHRMQALYDAFYSK